ncbi:MAG: LysR family transcriptional regulator [Calothrix sp. SM1_5_4]|nr:LysR family transcriptional regulator [Calothrix sp. SM1_5_4]
MTQPTLSMQIQKVEEEIGYPLFDRLKKPVVPTDKGQRFIAQARVLLHEHQKLIDLSRSQGAELSGEFRLGIIPTIAPYLLPRFIQAFSRDFPKVRLFVDELKTDAILKMLAEDTLDAGILATPLHEPGLRERPLYYEPFYLYVSKRNPLNARKRIREDDLSGEQMWLLEDGHCLRNQIVRYCSLNRTEGVFPNVRFEGGNIDTLRYLVRGSQGYTLIPALFKETLSDAEIRDNVREFERPAPTREVSLVYRRDQWKADILKALEECVRRNIPAELAKRDPKRQEVLDVKIK